MGFLQIFKVDWLSQHGSTTVVWLKPKSFSKHNNNMISQQAVFITLYFAFVELLTITEYFISFQLKIELQRNRPKLVTNFLMSWQPTQSLLLYTSKCKINVYNKRILYPDALLRYLKTLYAPYKWVLLGFVYKFWQNFHYIGNVWPNKSKI